MAIDGLSLEDETGNPTWQQVIESHQHPSISRSLWQVINTLVPYFGLWFLMVLSLESLLLADAAAGHPGGRVHDAYLYPVPRLRARLVL